MGNILSRTTLGQHTYTYQTDNNGNITREIEPLGGIVKHDYNAFNIQTKLTDANNNETEYTYDLLQRLTSEEFATGESDSYSYNAISALKRYTNQRRKIADFAEIELSRSYIV